MDGDATPPRIPVSASVVANGRGLGEPKLSPSGELVAFVSTQSGESPKLCVVDVTMGVEKFLTFETGPIGVHPNGGGAFDWCPDGRGLVFVTSTGSVRLVSVEGDNQRVIVAQQPVAGGVASPKVSPDGLLVAYVVDSQFVAVSSIDGASWPRVVASSADFVGDPSWSSDSEWLAWHEWDDPNMPWETSRWVTLRANSSGDLVAFSPDDTAVCQPTFAPVGTALAFGCDASGFMNVWMLDPETGVVGPLVMEPFEHAPPSWGPAAPSFAWSPDGTQVAFVRNENGFGRLCVVDCATRMVSEIARGWHFSLSWKANRLAAVRSGGVTPTQIVVYDTETASGGTALWTRTTLVIGPDPAVTDCLVEPEAVSFVADDGTNLNARLYRSPVVVSAAIRPLLLWLHGGPTDQMLVQYNGRLAFFLDRDWSILVPDYRGSTGHGREFQRALNGRWGELDTLDNIAALRAAIANQWGSAEHIAVIGASAGGFGVLHLMAGAPLLCAAGVNLFGVADLNHLRATTHRFEKHYLDSLIGDLEKLADRYVRNSPATHVDKIVRPLLILHGADDRVVPVEQSSALADALHALGRDVELHVYDGQGHGWRSPDIVADELERTDEFLRRSVTDVRRKETL